MAARATEPRADEAIVLRTTEQKVLAAEIPAFVESLRDPVTRARYEQVQAAVAEGFVPPALIGALEAFLELVLPLQRIRLEHGPEGARALTALFARTPRGIELHEAARDVNDALAALRGQAVEKIAFSPTPGGHRLTIETNGCNLSLAIDRAGVRVERLDVAGI